MTSHFEFADYHRTIIGYHGTTAEAAERLVNGEPFTESESDDDWFGKGIYFWEHAPKQAWWWARRRCRRRGDQAAPAVIGAIIRLGNCFDLLDAPNITVLKGLGEEYVAGCKIGKIEVPINVRTYKYLDCAVFNYLYGRFEANNQPIDSARGVYVWPTANRIWEASWIYDKTHIQTCIRNPKNILAVWHVKQNGRYGKEAS